MEDLATAPDLASWIRLEQTPGVGLETARRLLSKFGLPENIFEAPFSALLEVVPERIARLLAESPSPAILAQIDKTLEWTAATCNRILTLADTGYPPSLLSIPDPPLLLYAKGRIDLLSAASIAVVGSRNATAQGVINAEKFSAALSQAGFTIASGMALGIDAAAHKGGLAGPGSTVAVIGTGPDIVYPARNRGLAHQIAAEGCILSEYALGTPAAASNFPRRNRIISGLARGVLVIEAAAQSGSLITARMAGEQGRDVFAIPGSIHSPLSKGCHLLIKQGAKLVESAQDILEEISSPQPPPTPVLEAIGEPAEDADHPLLQAIGYDPVALDTLADRCKIGIAALNVELLTMELSGQIEMLPGGMIRRIATP